MPIILVVLDILMRFTMVEQSGTNDLPNYEVFFPLLYLSFLLFLTDRGWRRIHFTVAQQWQQDLPGNSGAAIKNNNANSDHSDERGPPFILSRQGKDRLSFPRKPLLLTPRQQQRMAVAWAKPA